MKAITFGESRWGFSHRREGVPCEDAALTKSLPEFEGTIFAVADGHGDRACVRSGVGSDLAVRIATEWLHRLGMAIVSPTEAQAQLREQILRDGSDAPQLRDIAGRIATDWERAVNRHLQETPLTEEELGHMGDAGLQRMQARPSRIYGTTLVAGLSVPGMVVLLQQGDGCCMMFDREGRATCPIPEDELCVANVTTSLCDEDAGERMRLFVLDDSDSRLFPVACFVATDGVDKSLWGEEGLRDFLGNVILTALKSGSADEMDAWLGEQLDALSQSGSGDDASLAGFVNLEAAAHIADLLRADHEEFGSAMLRRELESVMNSSRRGHELHEATRKAYEDYESAKKKLGELDGETGIEKVPTSAEAAVDVVGDRANETRVSDGVAVPVRGHVVEADRHGNVADLPSAEHASLEHGTRRMTRTVSRQRKKPAILLIVVLITVAALAAVMGIVVVPMIREGLGFAEETSAQAPSPDSDAKGDADAADGSSDTSVTEEEGQDAGQPEIDSRLVREITEELSSLLSDDGEFVEEMLVSGSPALLSANVPDLPIRSLAEDCVANTTLNVEDAAVLEDDVLVRVGLDCGDAWDAAEESDALDAASLVDGTRENLSRSSRVASDTGVVVYMTREDESGTWSVVYGREELSKAIREVSGFDKVCDRAWALISGDARQTVDDAPLEDADSDTEQGIASTYSTDW